MTRKSNPNEKTESPFDLRPIGYIESCFKEKFGTPRQSGLVREAWATLKILPEFQPEFSLEGIVQASHLWIIFWFHKNKVSHFHPKVHPPRLNGDSIGVFATRSPHRPNPIGLSLVRLDSVEGNTLNLLGVDFIDRTPVLDIKPYLPSQESIGEASFLGFENSVVEEFKFEWSKEALLSLEVWQKYKANKNLKAMIEEILSLDPRPKVYKGYEGKDSPYRSSHAIRLEDKDIFFVFLEKNRIRVEKIVEFQPLT